MSTTELTREYVSLQQAFNFFNDKLFNANLQEAFITLSRKRGARGYFWAQQFNARQGNQTIHEIALNPEHFKGRTDKDILSVLVHEMAHMWQEQFGQKKPRKNYHNREWADKMWNVGLPPSRSGLSPVDEYKEVKRISFIKDGSDDDIRLQHRYAGLEGKVQTGQSMSHYIQENGPFDVTCNELLAQGFKIMACTSLRALLICSYRAKEAIWL